MFSSMREGVSRDASTGYAAQKVFALFFALFLIIGALSFTGCPMDDDSSEGSVGLDPNLVGTWDYVFEAYNVHERYVITEGTLYYGNVSGDTFTDNFAGNIRYSEEFTRVDGKANGVIIIEFISGHEQIWMDSDSWHEDPPDSGNWVADPLVPQPTGKFYGIYYNGLEGGNVGDKIYLSNTTDIKNNYGPTVTSTLDLAKAKFTEANQTNFMDLSATSPQTKVKE